MNNVSYLIDQRHIVQGLGPPAWHGLRVRVGAGDDSGFQAEPAFRTASICMANECLQSHSAT